MIKALWQRLFGKRETPTPAPWTMELTHRPYFEWTNKETGALERGPAPPMAEPPSVAEIVAEIPKTLAAVPPKPKKPRKPRRKKATNG